MLQDIKELFQAFIAPALEGIRGDIRALDARFDSLDTRFDSLDTRISSLDTKMESHRRELLSEIHRVEQVLSADFVRLEQKVDLRLASLDPRFAAMDDKLGAFRRELLAEIKASSHG